MTRALRRARAVPPVLGAAVLLASCVSTAPAIEGADGIGDPYFPQAGNGGYDASHYDVVIDWDPDGGDGGSLDGVTTITARAERDLARINLDFALDVTGVDVDDESARFERVDGGGLGGDGDGELVVTLPDTVSADDEFTVRVTYSAEPFSVDAGDASPWFDTPTGVAVLGEPEAAAWWFPSNDHPSDKATFDITVTVPDGLQALSNGTRGEAGSSAGETSWTWSVREPMAPYLAFLAVGEYTITEEQLPSGVSYLSAVEVGEGEDLARAAAALATTPEVIAWLESKFGPYPFSAAGGVVVDRAYGTCCAVENQTRPTYPIDFWAGGDRQPTVVVHEQAHQWFGDSVSVGAWRDIFLNEGPAYYSEWLWDEEHGGRSAQARFDDTYDSLPEDDELWRVEIADPGVEDLLGDAVYVRGALTVHALRVRVGDETFSRILRDWVESRRFGNGSVEDFIALASQTSGQDLASFFDVWLYTAERPEATAENGFPV